MMSFISAIGVAAPEHVFTQPVIAAFMERAMQPDYTASRKLQAIFRASGIETRHSVLDDYGKQDNYSFYSNTKNFEPFPSTQTRLEAYRKHALPLSLRAVENCFEQGSIKPNEITHLIQVSCTGMYAPGLDIDLIRQLKLNEHVQRTCINFMGCYAAFNALKLADAICKADHHAVVLIVCTELCTLHFQKEPTEDNLLANALFADGAGALLVTSSPQPGWNLVPEHFHNGLAFNGKEHMAWDIGNHGFEMKLSSYVPDTIRTGIKNLTTELLNQFQKRIDDIFYFAIHPGGKKILEAIEQELGISCEQNEPAYAVLKKYGNMSSATILFVLHRIMRQLQPQDTDKLVLSFAFGPGLTLESMLLKTHYQ
ncbi:MAG: type III polyketide synthase [Cyclobacteriaceae bacterium]|nr:type III polyketide synthase [Cyclobacteriaceae bacterium]